MSTRLSGKTVVVTGSTKGIGRGAVGLLADQGAYVVITGRTAAAGEAAEENITSRGGQALFVQCDFTDVDQVRSLFNTVQTKRGSLDGLVVNHSGFTDNNAEDGPITEITMEGWNKIVATDLTAYFLALKYGIGLMCAGNGGSVVTISSHAALEGINGMDAHTAAKGAIAAVTRSIASYYARYEVRCNSLAVGMIDAGGAVARSLLEHPEISERVYAHSLGRIGEPSDIANALIYLLSDESIYVTGVVLPVDGGSMAASHIRRPAVADLPQYKRKRDRAPLY